MKLTPYIKYFLLIVVIFTVTKAFAADNKSILPFYKKDAVTAFDTIPQKKQTIPDNKKQKPDNSAKPDIKEVPKARPMPKPKVVGPKVKPVKIIKPKMGPKF